MNENLKFIDMVGEYAKKIIDTEDIPELEEYNKYIDTLLKLDRSKCYKLTVHTESEEEYHELNTRLFNISSEVYADARGSKNIYKVKTAMFFLKTIGDIVVEQPVGVLV